MNVTEAIANQITKGSYTTATVLPSERIDYWKNVITSKVVPLSFNSQGSDIFSASLNWAQQGDIFIAEIDASPHSVFRTKSNINDAGADSLIFNFLYEGSCLVEQDSASTLMTASSATRTKAWFCNAARPYDLHFGQASKLITMQIPRIMFEHNMAGIDRLTATDFLKQSALYSIINQYVPELLRLPGALDVGTAQRLANNITDLLSTAMIETLIQDKNAMTDSKLVTLLRIKSYINDNLNDTDLTPSKVADELRMSTRYINKLLEPEGVSLGRLIWKRRLEKVSKLLQTQSTKSSTISAFAFACGFNDMAHFSKAFRREFDVSPSEYRSYYLAKERS